MVIAGRPSETADALVAWLDDPANAALLLRSANAQAELRASLPAGDGPKGGPLEAKTAGLTGTLTSLGRRDARDKLEAPGARAAGSVTQKHSYVVAGEAARTQLATKTEERRRRKERD